MNIKSIKNKKILEVDNLLEFIFFSASNNYSDTNYGTLYFENVNLNTNLNGDILDFNISNQTVSSSSISFKIDYDIILDFQNNYIDFSKNNSNYKLYSDDVIFEIDNEGIITLRFQAGNSSFTLSYLESAQVLIQSFETNATFIDENSYMPEFSIASFDDSSFTIPRPVRQGIPIISTVPSYITNSSSSADINIYNDGKGTNSKTIHFRIICNKVMENITPGDTSEMSLKVYMPNGLDTVKKAIYEPMLLVSNDSTNNISIYRSSHTFYVQGIFDGIEYVDGFMYVDVQVPLTVQKSIPVEIDFVF